MSYRHTINEDGTPVQQSMTINPGDYAQQNLNTLMLGVVLDVLPVDHPDNTSSQQSADRKGHTHQAAVLVLRDGTSAYLVLDNVTIPPYRPSGLNDFVENLPRGCSGVTSGQTYSPMLHRIDPHDLDGDWCVVGFIGGQMSAPFIVSWWPHARNTFDPATSGEYRYLDQDGRYFSRVNGVETIVTTKGNVIVSTRFANSKVVLGSDAGSTEGRFPRSEVASGGSIRLEVKPSQEFEMTWDPAIEGLGILDGADPELPQTNPPTNKRLLPDQSGNTYVHFNSDNAQVRVPGVLIARGNSRAVLESGANAQMLSSQSVSISAGTDAVVTVGTTLDFEVVDNVTLTSSEADITLTAAGVTTIEAPQIKIGAEAEEEPMVLGKALQDWLTTVRIATPMGPANIHPDDIANIPDFLSEKTVVE